MMVGQVNLKDQFKYLITNNSLPQFIILTGLRGSGKKLLANEIVNYFKQNKIVYSVVCPDVKIDTIRTIIKESYKTIVTNIYIIPDADNMSNAAKNALLKVIEEPPNDSYFIMTLEDENNTLETIRSRGTVFHMDRYTPNEIEDYARIYAINQYKVSIEDEQIILPIICDLCETPGDVNILLNCSVKEFYAYVQLVVDNIAEVSLANVFKITDQVVTKNETGYDLKLFLKAFMAVCQSRILKNDHTILYSSWIVITSKYLQKLNVKGINKQMLIDSWILEIRRTVL